MTEKHIHIVSFNVPWPADYGGVIDVFYRIKTLHDFGVRVHLHCFCYGRDQAPILNQLCDEVFYYERNTDYKLQFNKTPFIVSSRCSKDLFDRLKMDRLPILLEGLHCCALLQQLRDYEQENGLAPRTIVVRTHNVEHDYYRMLIRSDRNITHRLYYAVEALRLKRYEKVLRMATAVAAISDTDVSHFKTIGCKSVELVTVFHPYADVLSQTGNGQFVLFHGDLTVADNERAALFIAHSLVKLPRVRLVIAGRNPSTKIRRLERRYPGVIEVIASPSPQEMDWYLHNAHVAALITFQATGMKLKLLNSLYATRFCVVNDKMVQGSGLDDLCVVVNDAKGIRNAIASLMQKPFRQEDIAKRREVLSTRCDNNVNVLNLIHLLTEEDNDPDEVGYDD